MSTRVFVSTAALIAMLVIVGTPAVWGRLVALTQPVTSPTPKHPKADATPHSLLTINGEQVHDEDLAQSEDDVEDVEELVLKCMRQDPDGGEPEPACAAPYVDMYGRIPAGEQRAVTSAPSTADDDSATEAGTDTGDGTDADTDTAEPAEADTADTTAESDAQSTVSTDYAMSAGS